jgi:Ca-activated chloride channel family protein
MTGERYFRATNGAALQQITQQIDQLERVPVRTRTYIRYTESYRWPLWFGAIALMTEIGLAARRAPLP